ncbi:MAG: hypothetical protein VX701_01430 [Chloroflexota bacterium]|nr:hypothetical protein [Chloroflexota bacterium]
MSDMHFDLTVFEDYRSGNSDARKLVDEVIDGAFSASVSVVTILQLWKDPFMNRQTEIMYASMLSFIEPVPLSVEAAKWAGRWMASLSAEETNDTVRLALVAATAKERNEPLCTRFPDRFEEFHIEVIGY